MIAVGANVSRGSWFAVRIEGSVARRADARLFPNLSLLVDSWGDASQILLGMPIGLPDAEQPTRQVDHEARRLLRPLRANTVFPVPSRAAIDAFRSGEARSYQALSKTNQLEVHRKLSRQSAGMVRKIAEVDELLTRDPALHDKVREAHREICFWGLNHAQPMSYPKARTEGVAERLDVIGQYIPWARTFFEKVERQFGGRVPQAVITDALGTALTAVPAHPLLGDLLSIPTQPQRDARGLRMEMVYRLPRV
ncbi:MAG: DUF429 domain-containing protein [Chloroflexi bacterium]|nr:DUF429 domain-containing protein [Chloroflexota bacterium]